MMKTLKLDKNRHNRNCFDCGVKELNSYLQSIANQQSNRDNTRTYILEDEKNPENIIGFYTLTMIALDFSSLPTTLQKKHHNVNSAGLIARLAVDKCYAGEGFGTWLLVDSLQKLLKASEIVAFPIVVVDAKDGVASFYEKFGFIPFLDEPNKLFMTMADIRKSFSV